MEEKVKLTRKQKQAKKAEFLSVKAYLYKKAQKRMVKLQAREAARQEAKVQAANPTKVDNKLKKHPWMKRKEAEHEHGENCTHHE